VRWRWIAFALIGLSAAWLVFCVAQFFVARAAAYDGMDRLEVEKEALEVDDLLAGEGRDGLEQARGDFSRARRAVDHPLLAPARWLPVVGRQIRSIDALASSAEDAVEVGMGALDTARRTVDETSEGSPAGRVEAMVNLATLAASTRDELGTLDLGPDEALIGSLRRARDRFVRELDDVDEGLRRVDESATGAAAFLEGPTRYLVLAANNAEMRAGMGMLLSAGTLDVNRGEFDVGAFRPTGDLRLPPGAVVLDDGDMAARWGFVGPEQEWRNLGMTPRFPATAELASQMWRAATGEQVDGVLVLDPFALRALLEVTGPVVVEGEEVSAETVLEELFVGQYVGLDDVPLEQAQRRERQGLIAEAALDALDRGGWDAAELVGELRGAAAGRHVLAWSAIPEQQEAWRAAGIDGSMKPSSLGLAVLSEGGNKLDQFLEVTSVLSVRPDAERTEVEIEITLTNTTPEGLPRYVQGPSIVPGQPGRGVGEGVYAGLVAVTVPGSASEVAFGGEIPVVTGGPDGPTAVLAGRAQIARGESLTVVIRFDLPPGPGRMRVEPSARTPPIDWVFEDEHWNDGERRTVRWE